ncbi:MARVEL domain-containing protein 1 isoform 2-T2 [Menidia menidia]
MPPQASQSQVKSNILRFLRSFLGIVRILQIVLGAGLWVTIAANKQDLVPLLGGERWLCTNLAHDVAAAALYLPAIGVMIYKTERNSYCNLDLYKHPCLYKVYLTAAVFACLGCLAYLLAVVYGACRKCRGEQTVI